MNTRYIHIDQDIHQFIRIDHPAGGGESIISATNIPLSKLGKLIEALQKLEQSPEHPIMTAVLGAKPDPTAWYARALRAEAEKPIEVAPNFKNPVTGWTPDNPVHQPPMPKPIIGDGIINVSAIPTKVHKRHGKAIYGGNADSRHCADILPGAWIRLYGLSDEHSAYDPITKQTRRFCTAYDITFNIGDECEYGSYNFIYTGEIVSIGAKTVTIKKGHGGNTRLDLHTFNWRNWDYDAEKIAKHNAIESQVQ